ncbi:hypothetical protein DSL72_001112 [Monilinia vaccinii-corymbosi]|uniref:Putative lipoate-protein ligase A n=1 Tax=Monilinia vaccinii-corymbosi TaxID=61207 RepID=A0A8A3P0X4_9HELO|nr:hypothetical protein DSL72_001112 [Monilinia vaccinii-corymbosi]
MAPPWGLISQFMCRGTMTPLPRSFFARRHYSSSSSSSVSEFMQNATNPINKTQVYISRSLDPYINLSIEHYLLEKTPADSTILFLYTNKPSVVIGRNQNPWNEVKLSLITGHPVSLVRRRSGGGTVYHDMGNVNYCVICPTSCFDRDKHAEMVVRALHKLGQPRAAVNARHDIVLKPGGEGSNSVLTYKISGSAYKLTRERSLHHGTCLLNNADIALMCKYLLSPAKRFIEARGVKSVSSKVTMAEVENEAFERAVMAEFGEMYGSPEPIILTENLKGIPEIAKGIDELTSPEWIFSQTPQFTFTTDQSQKPKKKRFPIPRDIPKSFEASFTARNGAITKADIHWKDDSDREIQIGKDLVGKNIFEIEWNRFPKHVKDEPLMWLSKLFSAKVLDWDKGRERNA